MLTPRQAAILEMIRGHYLAQGCPPTLREVMAAFNIGSTNGVVCHVNALRAKGYLKPAQKGISRALVPTGYVVVPESDWDRARRLARENDHGEEG